MLTKTVYLLDAKDFGHIIKDTYRIEEDQIFINLYYNHTKPLIINGYSTISTKLFFQVLNWFIINMDVWEITYNDIFYDVINSIGVEDPFGYELTKHKWWIAENIENFVVKENNQWKIAENLIPLSNSTKIIALHIDLDKSRTPMNQ